MTPADHTRFDFSTLTARERYKLLIGTVIPRPIALATTISTDGRHNAGAFSFFNVLTHDPAIVAIGIENYADMRMKDTARNILRSREFVVNVATVDNMDLMHRSAAEYGPEVSEAEVLGIPLLPSRHVQPPRIAVSPVQMECRLDQAITLGRGVNTLYIGEVVAFHLADTVFDGRRVDAEALRPIARLGGPRYAALGELFDRPMLQRPPGGEGWADDPKT